MLAIDCEHCRSHYNFINLYGDDENALSEEGYCDITGHSIAFKCSPRWPRFVVLDSTRFYRLRQLLRWRVISLASRLIQTFKLCRNLTDLSYNAANTRPMPELCFCASIFLHIKRSGEYWVAVLCLVIASFSAAIWKNDGTTACYNLVDLYGYVGVALNKERTFDIVGHSIAK